MEYRDTGRRERSVPAAPAEEAGPPVRVVRDLTSGGSVAAVEWLLAWARRRPPTAATDLVEWRRALHVVEEALGARPAPAAPISRPAARRALPPRLERVLAVLLQGVAEKQVARTLGLSPHTVHEYVKRLYEHFGVASRAELLVALLGRGGPP